MCFSNSPDADGRLTFTVCVNLHPDAVFFSTDHQGHGQQDEESGAADL